MKAKNPFDLVVDNVRQGYIGVIPTDTIYGIVGIAQSKRVVEKIYHLRRRNPKKPMIILVGSLNDVRPFGITLSQKDKKILKAVWPGKVSVVMPIKNNHKKFAYLHRGTKALAFRLPKHPALRRFLKKTGPLVAPSANVEGELPARTIKEAKGYFGEKIHFYVDTGRLASRPSTLISLENGVVTVLRTGAVKM